MAFSSPRLYFREFSDVAARRPPSPSLDRIPTIDTRVPTFVNSRQLRGHGPVNEAKKEDVEQQTKRRGHKVSQNTTPSPQLELFADHK